MRRSADVFQIRGEYTLRGHKTMTIHVHDSGVVWIRGTLAGSLIVDPGGRAHVFGTVHGDVRNDGGEVILRGTVRGEVASTDEARTLDLRPPNPIRP